jgi:hypothetical protein
MLRNIVSCFVLFSCYFTCHHNLLVGARPDYLDRIPNGRRVHRQGQLWIGVGHESSAGGGPRNPFGLDFQSAGLTWTTSLCNSDSDGDGYTNGQELGDPLCQWSSTLGGVLSNSTASHPGFIDSTPVIEERLALRQGAQSPGPYPDRETVLTPGESGVVDGYLMPRSTVALSFVREPWVASVNHLIEYVEANPSSWSFSLVVPVSTNPFSGELSIQYSRVNVNSGDMIYVAYYNLTAFGNQRILEYLQRRQQRGGAQRHLRLHARGELSATTRLFNATEVWGATITVTGIIADIFCVDRVLALDGANMIQNPDDHTIHCLILDQCIPGGFTILEEPRGARYSSLVTYGPMYNLSAVGNQKVVDWAKTLPMHQKNLRWAATGYLESDGTFQLLTFIGPDPILPIYGIVLIAIFSAAFVVIVVVVAVVVIRRKSAPTATAEKCESEDTEIKNVSTNAESNSNHE